MRGAMRAQPGGQVRQGLGYVGEMLDADGDDDPAGDDLLAVGEHQFEPVSSPDHAGDENLFDLQVEFGLEPLTVADEVSSDTGRP